jgi:NIPSNAP protein
MKENGSMRRRSFLAVPAGAALIEAQESAPPARAIIELRYFYMRSGKQVDRTTEYLRRGWLPAAQRAGVGPVGFFNSLVAPESPFIVTLTSFTSLAAIGDLARKLAADQEFQKVNDEYNSTTGELSYIRMENSLLLAFPAMPAVEVPPLAEGKPPRIFELRTYESPNDITLQRKVKMFGDGEIDAFRRSGMLPVFFGSVFVGRDLPKLTYMLAYDDWQSREKNWSAFGKDPGWQKLRVTPGLSDPEIVSNISNAILRPLAFSPIR